MINSNNKEEIKVNLKNGAIFFVVKGILLEAITNEKEKITIPDGVKIIQKNAFNKCSGTTEILFPSSLLKIYEGAFKNCKDLKKIIIQGSRAVNIGDHTFINCNKNLKIINGQKEFIK